MRRKKSNSSKNSQKLKKGGRVKIKGTGAATKGLYANGPMG
jgi:hypothetical protein